MNILLVEDELLIQKSLKKMLEKKGATVTVCSSGKDAIAKISDNKFDRIICDLMLQDITGFDVIEESKKFIPTDDIKNVFIIITAYTSSQVLEKAASYGCQVIGKPFDDMKSVIQKFLTK